MPITQSLNSKANVKKSTNQDLPFSVQQPVISSYYAVSTASQTVINFSFSVDTVNLTDQFFLFVAGKKLTLGASNDYVFTSINSNNLSTQVTLNQSLAVNLNIQAYMLGLKKESEFNMDNRFVQLYEAQGQGFQGFVNQNTLIVPTATAGTPAAGTFVSSIVNRASIIDLSQDLKSRMGIDRVMTQQISQLQNEFGPNGEPVWSTPNDQFGQVRFVGSWINGTSIAGEEAYTVTPGDAIEITFFGTGLNVLTYAASPSARNASIFVDGVAAGTFTQTTTATSSVLGGRNYASNSVINAVTGLTLGIHTVLLVVNTAFDFFGFEILNESSVVKVTPGVAYVQGKKYVSSALQSFAYNASVSGTKGGRVVVYQNGNGTISQSFQAVNVAAAYLASADHTNEEVARTYNFKEFGSGRADDFSGNLNTGTYAFTLDDGTTTLAGSSVAQTFAANTQILVNNAANGFISLTFVGTGLDFIRIDQNNTTIDASTILVDGTSIGTLSGVASTNTRKQSIVSGLPYGTHTVRITRNAAAAVSLGVSQFIVYQPKKPTLPSGAVELADYNVAATFVANTVAGLDTVSTGTIRKNCIREIVYVEGTGGTANYLIDSSPNSHVGGSVVYSDRLNASASYTFFGTGVDFRYQSGNNRSNNISVTLNGLAATTANFSTLTSSVYGLGSFSAGTLSQNGATTATAGLVISGLPLGTYTIKLNNNVASSFIIVEAFDIITPIHSAKSNTYFDLQNTLPVGSQGISDNRKLTAVKDILPGQKASAQAIGVALNPTVTATSFVPMPDMSITIKVKAGKLKISYSALLVLVSGSAATVSTVIYVDGIKVGQTKGFSFTTVGFYTTVSDTLSIPVSDGVHKVDVYWNTNGSPIGAQDNSRNLLVEES